MSLDEAATVASPAAKGRILLLPDLITLAGQ